MKNYRAWIVYTLLGYAGGLVEGGRAATVVRAEEIAQAEVAPPRIVERWGDGRIWERVTTQTLTNGTVISQTNRWTDLANGLHYWDENQWKESRAEISLTAQGAEARQAPHKVQFTGNINTVGAITITTRDNHTLRGRVIGLAYSDPVTGNSVLIAQTHDSIGQLFAPNQVVYHNAFSDVLADVRYTYTRHGFEQDVILRENPAPPSSYGLNNETTLLEVWTEFTEAPEPAREAHEFGGLSDQNISFGKMRLRRGAAFAFDAAAGRVGAAPVGKTWLIGNGRQYLIESVRRRSVLVELNRLPQLQAANAAPPGSRLALLDKIQPPKAAEAQPVRMAVDKSLFNTRPGLVLDYELTESDYGDFTFQADTTYLISDYVSIWGTMTVEGGTVIKIATTNSALIAAEGDIIMKTDPYRPAIFTSQMDNTVGQNLSSPGAPMKCYAGLACGWVSHEFKHLRISHALYGLQTVMPFTLRDAQFTDCTRALHTHFATAEIDNVLFYNIGWVWSGTEATVNARHVTLHQCATQAIDYVDAAYSSIAFTNCLLVNVTNNGPVSFTTNYTVTTSSNIFQTVGAGAHYLADPSPYRDAGTTNIPATLAARLRRTTTYPPLVIDPAGYYGVSQTFTPRCGWDTDLPDLGYHYEPIDYAVSHILLTNATIQVDPGTAIAVFNTNTTAYYGVSLNANAKFISSGRADTKVTVTHYATVQEMANTNWNGPLDGLIVAGATSGTQELRCRFTDFTVLGGSLFSLYSPTTSFAWKLTDCQFHSGGINDYGAPFTFTNCLFNRCSTSFEDYSTETNWMFNCTFFGGGFYASLLDLTHGHVRDTLFSSSVEADVTSSNIGYFGGSRLSPTNANDKVLSSLSFQTGSLGYFYIASNALVNAGSRNATNAGLYHYTMLTNNVKETNTIVDIGFHYVATDVNGIPLDNEGDGIPDYWEDTNGNGSTEITETNWLLPDTDGDGVWDGEEVSQGRNPIGGAFFNTNNILNLRVFTPLK